MSKSIESSIEAETKFNENSVGNGENVPGQDVRRVRIRDSEERPKRLGLQGGRDKPIKSLYLKEGESHQVWKPTFGKKAPQLARVVTEMLKSQGKGLELRRRQQTLFHRVQATQAVLREQNEELISTEENEPQQQKKHISLKEASKRISKNLKQKKQNESPVHFQDIVSQYLAKMRSENRTTGESATGTPTDAERHTKGSTKQERSPVTGALPIQKWKALVREQRRQTTFELGHPELGRSISENPQKKMSGKPGLARHTSEQFGGKGVAFAEMAESPAARSPLVKQKELGKQEGTGTPQGSQGRRPSAPFQRQQWQEWSVGSDSIDGGPERTKEDRLQDEVPEMAKDAPIRQRSPSPSWVPFPRPQDNESGEKPDNKGMSVGLSDSAHTDRTPSPVPSEPFMIEVLPAPSKKSPFIRQHSAGDVNSGSPVFTHRSTPMRKTFTSGSDHDKGSPIIGLPHSADKMRPTRSSDWSIQTHSSGLPSRSSSATPEATDIDPTIS